MATVSPLANASQYGLLQSQAAQARRDADQAERTAQALRAEAEDAQRFADGARTSARSLAGRAQALGREQIAAQGDAVASVSQMERRMIDQSGKSIPATTNAASAAGTAVVNIRGQVTGAVISITA